MAKGPLFLGMGRGKVGELVLYRSEGEQITRTRNRHPRNPNTDAQIIQRATMAVVQRLYSLGYPIFNHAFQGYRPGAENQRRFLKVNAKMIRDAVLASLNGSSTPVYLGAPGILSPSANAYIVSEGNYDQQLFSYDATVPANPVWKLPAVGDATTVAEYAAAHGMVPGDIYTFLGVFTKADVMDYEYFDQDGQLVEDASVRKASFAYLQVKVKDDILTNTAAISSSTPWSELFDEVRGTAGATTLNSGLSMVEVAGFDGSGAWGCIRSRENEDLRSTTQLQLFGNQSGVTPEWLFRVWSKEVANLASDLILEGADFNGAGYEAPVRPTNLIAIPSVSTAGRYYLGVAMSDGSQQLVTYVDNVPYTAQVEDGAAQFEITCEVGTTQQKPENVNSLVEMPQWVSKAAASTDVGISDSLPMDLVPESWNWDQASEQASWDALPYISGRAMGEAPGDLITNEDDYLFASI